jgi:steroid delta-isomerase-like uncharacterized protein
MTDHNKVVARRWTEEIWNRGDFTSAKGFIADNLHFSANQIPPFDGVNQLKETVSGFRAGFPDGRFPVDEVVAEGDTVVMRWTFRGTHRGEWMGVPGTGKQVEVTGTATTHFKNGKVAEHQADWDALRMMQHAVSPERSHADASGSTREVLNEG